MKVIDTVQCKRKKNGTNLDIEHSVCIFNGFQNLVLISNIIVTNNAKHNKLLRP